MSQGSLKLTVPRGLQPGQASATQRQFIKKLTMLIAGGMFIDGFILGSVGILMPAITKDLQLSLAWQGLIGASALIGIFIGGPIGGLLADKLGRKPMFTIDLALFLFGSIAQFFVQDAAQLFLVRLLMGFAIGADYAVGWPMLAEFAPARLRGKLLAVQEIGWYLGYLISYTVGWFLTVSAMADWNLILSLSAVPTLIVLLLRLGTPESPRWLMSKGRKKEAQSIALEYMEEAERLDLERTSFDKSLTFRHIFSPKYAKATFFVSIFWVCSVTPYFAIGTFTPFVLQQLGFSDGMTGGLALNLLTLLGAIVCTFLIERWGRRVLAIPPFFVSAVALVTVAVVSPDQSMIIVIAAVAFFFFNAVSSTLCGVYPAEVFPTEIRGAGVGFATAVSRIGAAAGTFLLPISIVKLGMPATMIISAGICLIGGAVSYWMAPETKGVSLSQSEQGKA